MRRPLDPEELGEGSLPQGRDTCRTDHPRLFEPCPETISSVVSVTITHDDVERVVSKVTLTTAHKSADFHAGVRAMANAMWSIHAQSDGGAKHPIPGMVVQCRSRPCKLLVRDVKHYTKEPDDPRSAVCVRVEVVPDEGWGNSGYFQQHDRRFRQMKLSTWRRWTRGARVIVAGKDGNGEVRTPG